MGEAKCVGAHLGKMSSCMLLLYPSAVLHVPYFLDQTPWLLLISSFAGVRLLIEFMYAIVVSKCCTT